MIVSDMLQVTRSREGNVWIEELDTTKPNGRNVWVSKYDVQALIDALQSLPALPEES